MARKWENRFMGNGPNTARPVPGELEERLLEEEEDASTGSLRADRV
jgi:hypothetical protein